MPIGSILVNVFKFLAKAFGLVLKAKQEQKRTVGLEAKNAMLEKEILRGDETEKIKSDFKKTDANGAPYFDFDGGF